MSTENLTINAKWQINQYTITIKFNNGDADKVITQDYNTPIESVDNPSKTGYIFSGWDKEIPTVMPAENLTINARMYAIFTINNGTITGLTTQGESLANIEIPSSIDGQKITSIGDYAFYECDSLKSIVIPNSVTSIGNYAFALCTSLTSIEIPNSVTSIGDRAFSCCYSLTSIVIPNSVTSIGDWAFSSCRSLTSIEIPNSVTSIGDGAFAGCCSLTSIEIPNSVTSIGYRAFLNCTSLTSIVIPNSVTSIGDRAFEDCPSLTIYCKAESKPSGWSSGWNSNRPVVWGYKGE